jgi:D-3-phosphoglycerate dehydrogenase / 2-oxoglutarate reductase
LVLKPPVLQNGPVSYAGTMKKIDELFTAHKLWLAPDKLALAKKIGPEIICAFTSGHDPIPTPILDALPRLKLVACFGVGVDGVNVAELASRGITVTNTPDVLTEEVADFAMGLLLATVRQIVKGDRYVRSGDWLKRGNMEMTWSLTGGKTIGIVGLGRIGKELARMLTIFGTTTLYHDILEMPAEIERALKVTRVGFDDLLARSDIVTLHVPLTDLTRHMIDRAALARMKPGAYLINCARGPVVSETALIEALDSGRLGGAGLDTFEVEPLPGPSPFARFRNVVITPHHAPGTVEAMQLKMQDIFANIDRFRRGEALADRIELG